MNTEEVSNGLFDNIAEAYYAFTPDLPEEYIKLLMETFKIRSGNSIIDLGCGSGDLALTLAKYSSHVQGLDISQKMISMAVAKDRQKEVTWFHKSVADFDLGEEKYDLIISFESFHLFPNQKELIQRCARALKPGGFLGIGWRMYEWDIPLKELIKDTFAAYGIDRGKWGLWTCPNFSQDVVKAQTSLKAPQKKKIALKTRTPLDVIASYVLHNSRSSVVSNDLKQALQKDLAKRFLDVYPSGESEGYTEYSLVYSQK